MEKRLDIRRLTTLLGQPDHEQSAVQAWTGDPYGTTWTPEEAADLKRAWDADRRSMIRD